VTDARPSLAVLAALAGVAVTLTGCLGVETTPEKSARKAKLAGTRIAEQKGVVIGAANTAVEVQGTTVLQDPNGVAAVVHLKNTGSTQVAVPVGITVDDAKGKKLYANDIPGLDPSLTSLPVLEAGQEADWVNNQILVTGKASRLKAEIGRAKGRARGTVPEITLAHIAQGRDADGSYAKGTISNDSAIAQKRIVITCVARDGDRVVAAGRAIIDRLLPAAGLKKPTTFTVFFIGDPKQARLGSSAPPTVLSGGTQ
jgi:hypothetical protein